MRNYDDLMSDLNELATLYKKIERMSEKDAQEEMNTNESKSQILMYLQEDMDELQEQIDEIEASFDEEEQEPWYRAGLDPAFGSWREYYSMRV